ncbi:MAG: hypothetical protein U5O39_20840 [Gammaproteobacteria bacterium]|nr:hypothetical protein [Gammaproteobacteria bacterium]
MRSGRRRKEWLTELNEIDARIHEIAQRCNARTRAVVESALDRTRLGGGVIAQLRGADRSLVLQPDQGQSASKLVGNPDQETVIHHLASAVPKAGKRDEALMLQELLSEFGRRRTVLGRLRRDISLKSWLQIWLHPRAADRRCAGGARRARARGFPLLVVLDADPHSTFSQRPKGSGGARRAGF